LFHASIENSEPTIAAPIAQTHRGAAGRPKVDAKISGQCLRVPADGDAEQDQQRERTGLDCGEGRLDQGRRAHAADVDPREHGDGEDGENALRREADRDVADRLREVQGRAEEHVGRQTGPEDGGEPRERDGDRRDGARLDDYEQRPAVQVAEQGRDPFAQIHVLSARAREHRRQLAIGHRAHEGYDTRHRPDDEQEARGVDLAEDLRRDDENPRADHRPDDEGGGVEPGDRLDEIGLRLLGGGHLAR